MLGARRYARELGVDLKECYKAWIPEPDLDSRPDVKGAVRISEADGISVRVMTGRTPLGRRLAMVAGVDVVVTISGRQHTESLLSRPWSLACPSFPYPTPAAIRETSSPSIGNVLPPASNPAH